MIGFVLTLIGFGAKGVIKRSIAALIQSWMVDVKAGSIFARLTSLGMSL